MKHAKSVKDVERLSESLTNALNLVKKAKLLFEFQTDYTMSCLAQSEILDLIETGEEKDETNTNRNR